MKILVLGSEGQIGKPFCEFAETNGHTVYKIDKKLFGENQDLSKDSSKGLLNEYLKRCDVVLFLAFEVGGSKFLERVDKTFDYISENIRLMDNCFSALNNSKKPFLFASSQMANMHHTNYGFLKDLGERYTRSINGWICRFWNVYGYETFDDPKSHVITDFIKMALTSTAIKMRTDGAEERQFLHISDCVKALLYWCEYYVDFDRTKYLDITNFEWTSIAKIASIISNVTGCGVKPGDRKDSIQKGLKNEPTPEVLKFWKPLMSVEDGIKDVIMFHSRNKA